MNRLFVHDVSPAKWIVYGYSDSEYIVNGISDKLETWVFEPSLFFGGNGSFAVKELHFMQVMQACLVNRNAFLYTIYIYIHVFKIAKNCTLSKTN